MLCCVSNITILFEFTRVTHVRDQPCQTLVTSFLSILWSHEPVCSRTIKYHVYQYLRNIDIQEQFVSTPFDNSPTDPFSSSLKWWLSMMASRLCIAVESCCGFFYLVAHQPCNAETDTFSSLTTRFIFIEVTFGRMPILTKRSRTSTLQKASARLSKNHTRVTFASDTRVAFGVGFLCTIVALMPETALVSLRTLAVFLSAGNKYLFLLQRHSFPYDFLTTAPDSIFPCLASKFRNRNFCFFTPLLYCLQFLTIGHRYLLMNLHVVQFQYWRILNLCRLSQISSDGIFDIDRRTWSHLVSNSCTLSSWRRVTEIKTAYSNSVSWAPVTRKLS